jgi:hypothetical protein
LTVVERADDDIDNRHSTATLYDTGNEREAQGTVQTDSDDVVFGCSSCGGAIGLGGRLAPVLKYTLTAIDPSERQCSCKPHNMDRGLPEARVGELANDALPKLDDGSGRVRMNVLLCDNIPRPKTVAPARLIVTTWKTRLETVLFMTAEPGAIAAS